MATIEDNIAALEAGLATGEASVDYDGFRVTYRSVAEIERALAYWRARQREASGKRGGIQVSYGSFNRAG